MPDDLTNVLQDSSVGVGLATDRLAVELYEDLRVHARKIFHNERNGATLSPTAVVHEAYLRLVDVRRIDWNGKTHFKAMAARSMQRVLVDAARARAAEKRGSGAIRVVLDEGTIAGATSRAFDFLGVHEALERLARLNARYAEVVRLRFFGGMSLDEIAAELDITERTVKRDWRAARTWLLRALGS